MKILRSFAVLALFLVTAPALAQQVQNHAVPLGRGAGVSGFGAAVPGTAGRPLVSQGATVDPSFGTIANSGFTPGAANTAKGSLDGASVVDLPLPSCTAANQAWKYTSGIGISCGSVTTTAGFDTPVNFGMTASAAGNALTINVTQASGSAPSAGSPVLVPFRSLSANAGTIAYSTISAALSITIPNGATLGTSSGSVPFRIWVFLTANAGTPAIGVATCSNATTLFPCASWEYALKTTTTISAGAGTGGVLYVGTGVASDAVRIVGYCDFGGGLVTAGAWASSCTALQVFGPGIKKPGDVVQSVHSVTGASTVGTNLIPNDDSIPQNVEGNQYMSQAFTPTATPNILEIETQLTAGNTAGSSGPLTVGLFQDATASAIAAAQQQWAGNNSSATIRMDWRMVAATVASTTFAVRAGNSAAGTTTFNGASSARLMGGAMNSFIRIREIMGFDVREPANDNLNPGVFSATG